MERIDCHSHIFNMVSVGWRVILGQVSDAVSRKEKGMTEKGLMDKFGKIAGLIKAFTKDSPHIFKMLDKEYKKKYRLFALMFDGDFLLDDSVKEELRDLNRKFKDYFDVKDKQPVQEVKPRSGQGVPVPAGQGAPIPAEEDEMQWIVNYLNELTGERKTRDIRAIGKDGFTVQYEHIKKMSEDDGFKKRLIPFLGVDPRRENIKTFLDEVGKDKLFAGIKVYPPNGFSPCDKVLTGPGSVFEFCSQNRIPVVSHCSYGGFATPVKSVEVNGMIIPDGKNEPEIFEGTYNFRTGLKDGFGVMVKERAVVLNHPKIWAEVLNKYENLILVLAHFGVGSDKWQDEILQMMYTYKNLYTDVSCISEDAQLERVKDIYNNNPEIRHKILYGSDFFLNLLFNDSFREYKKRMEMIFGKKMFDQLSIHNPTGFMAKWY